KARSVRLCRDQHRKTGHGERWDSAIESRSNHFPDDVAVSRRHGNNELRDAVLFDDRLNGTESPHDGELEEHVILLHRIVVNEADRLETKMRVGDQLLRDELRGVACADNQSGATW